MPPQARPIIRHHHEKMDGTGYPDGLKGNEIPSAHHEVFTEFRVMMLEDAAREAEPPLARVG